MEIIEVLKTIKNNKHYIFKITDGRYVSGLYKELRHSNDGNINSLLIILRISKNGTISVDTSIIEKIIEVDNTEMLFDVMLRIITSNKKLISKIKYYLKE